MGTSGACLMAGVDEPDFSVSGPLLWTLEILFPYYNAFPANLNLISLIISDPRQTLAIK
jgi:hypothetical protein